MRTARNLDVRTKVLVGVPQEVLGVGLEGRFNATG